jgi:predicted acylesterase/phospholipase RssA
MAKFDLVFEGGGAKGIAFVGALEVLLQQGHTWRRLLGTSAGAITATLCAAGYSQTEMMNAILEKLPDGSPRFSSFMDIPAPADFTPEILKSNLTLEVLAAIDIPLVPKAMESSIDRALLDQLIKNRTYARVFSFMECGGLYAGQAFLNWIREKLAAKNITATDTLATFAQKTGSDLSIIASDTTDMEMLVLNQRTAPNVPIANAVRMSMSIPFVWQEVIWQQEWGTYRGRNKAGNTIVDGGVLSNFPIRLIATTDDDTQAIMGNTDPNGAGNLGLLIDENLPVPGAPDTKQTPLPITHLQVVQRVSRLVDTMTEASDNDAIRRFASQICHLPAKNYGTLEFGMSGDRLNMFLQAARTAMTQHLTGLAAAAGAPS